MNLEFLEQRVTAPGLFGDRAAFFMDLRGRPYCRCWSLFMDLAKPSRQSSRYPGFKLLFMTKGHGRRKSR